MQTFEAFRVFEEAFWFESRDHIELLCCRIVVGFSFCRRDVADGSEQAVIVEPVDPFQRGVFDSLERSPRATPVDDLGLVKAVDRLG